MKVQRLLIQNFRGIKNANLSFDSHALLVGANNVGKSTICEALDLVLGLDRLNRLTPVEEFDFYNGGYLKEDKVTPQPLRVEVILVELSPEVERKYASHVELWHISEKRLLGQGEADKGMPPDVVRCLRLETLGDSDPEEDEFVAQTFFSHSPNNEEGKLDRVGKELKRLIGFLYLRALRTGSRALSLERGSLLDIILRLQGARTGLWESSIQRLRDLTPPIDAGASGLTSVLNSIEKRLAQYISVSSNDRATHLYVSQLTREHLRKTISFFLSLATDQKPVPFQGVGAGTLNTLVLALLSFIAETKKDNVIFAMEEPEIALPPHTQRRVANYLLKETTQCFVTSHSPYVIERFEPQHIFILRRSAEAELTATVVKTNALSGKMYKRHARRGLAEAMLGRGVIVTEGIADASTLIAVAQKMEDSDSGNYPLDLSGVTICSFEGEGSLPHFGAFFRALNLKAYAFYDRKKRRTPDEVQVFTDNFDVLNEIPYSGIELLLVAETPVNRQWGLLKALKEAGECEDAGIPDVCPADDEVKEITTRVLKSNKGSNFGARLIDSCEAAELPYSITTFLARVYADFPKPEPSARPDTTPLEGTAAAAPSPIAPADQHTDEKH